MPNVVVKNSCIEIEDYDFGYCRQLENCFKKWDPVTHSYTFIGLHYDSTTRKLIIPRGVDIWKIKEWMGVKYHSSVAPSPYKETGPIKMKYKPRDEVQEESLKFMIGLDQYEDNMYQPQLSLNLVTGKGKTYCSVATMSYFQINSIVITGSLGLLTQWKNDILEYTSLRTSDIFMISGSETINMIFRGKSPKAKHAKIFLCSHGTIKSYCDQYGWDKLDKLFRVLGIGMKFIDEAHKNFANMLMIDFFSNVYKTFYVTATPNRSSWQEDRIYQLSNKNIPFIDLFNAEEDPHVDYMAIKWNSHPNPFIMKHFKNAYGLDRNKYVNWLTSNPYFYQMMYLVMEMFLNTGGRGLFYIGTNNGILKVYNWICQNYPEISNDIGIYTSIIDKETKQEYKRNKRLLLTTIKSAGEGEDIKGLKFVALLAEPFKSQVLTRQTLGRLRDKDTQFIELVDLGFHTLNKFYNAKLPVLNKYAQSVTDYHIDTYELEKRAEKLENKRQQVKRKTPFYFVDKRFFDENGNMINVKDKDGE